MTSEKVLIMDLKLLKTIIIVDKSVTWIVGRFSKMCCDICNMRYDDTTLL